jgi:dihydroflavonol-4-reductase
MPIALVTGATGFVGANIVAALGARGWRVRVLARATSSRQALEGLDCEVAPGDVLDTDSLARAMAGVDAVYHVAGVADYWRASVTRLYEVNVGGTRNVMRAAHAAGVARVVHTSSCAALGAPARGRPADEQHPFNLPPERFRYGHSKWLAEQEVLAAVRAGLAAVTVLPSVILGPRDVNFISGSLIREAARGLLVAVPPGGVNVVHVDDVVAGHLAAAERGVPGERYILAGENLTHRELARVVCETVGVRPPRLGVPRAALPVLAGALALVERVAGPRLPLSAEQLRLSGEEMYFDGSKARQAFGLPLTPARVAVADAYHWYKERAML